MNEISALIKESQDGMFTLFALLHVKTQWEVDSLQPETGLSLQPSHTATLTFDFQLPELREKCLLFISHLVYAIFVIKAWAKTEISTEMWSTAI